MIAVNIDVPKRDVDAFTNALERFAGQFAKGPREAVKKATVYIVRSLRASTKKSVPQRKVVRNPNYVKPTNKRARQLQHIRAYYAGRGKGYKDTADYFDRFAIERLTQGKGAKHTTIYGLPRNVTEAKREAQSRLAKVYFLDRRGTNRSGLAKSSWGWMLGRLGQSASSEVPVTSQMAEVTETSTPFRSEIQIVNKLAYIRKALKSNVGSVLERAAKSIIDDLEGHTKRARQQAGLRAA